MTVYEYKLGKRLPVGKCAVAIGFFDGVHLAHRELILAASEEAKRLGVAAGVVTFASESSIKAGIPRLYDTCDKLSLIESLGVDFTVICDFSDVAGLSGEEFVRDTLSGDIGAVSVAAGFNFKFGKGDCNLVDGGLGRIVTGATRKTGKGFGDTVFVIKSIAVIVTSKAIGTNNTVGYSLVVCNVVKVGCDIFARRVFGGNLNLNTFILIHCVGVIYG